mmetsp:Transcript_33034/g.67406  ORF Transcript_33034/g.67406 Transcript_33034/m.67406 type:complete len:245 (+) Transcript_33034:79-813(+)
MTERTEPWTPSGSSTTPPSSRPSRTTTGTPPPSSPVLPWLPPSPSCPVTLRDSVPRSSCRRSCTTRGGGRSSGGPPDRGGGREEAQDKRPPRECRSENPAPMGTAWRFRLRGEGMAAAASSRLPSPSLMMRRHRSSTSTELCGRGASPPRFTTTSFPSTPEWRMRAPFTPSCRRTCPRLRGPLPSLAWLRRPWGSPSLLLPPGCRRSPPPFPPLRPWTCPTPSASSFAPAVTSARRSDCTWDSG